MNKRERIIYFCIMMIWLGVLVGTSLHVSYERSQGNTSLPVSHLPWLGLFVVALLGTHIFNTWTLRKGKRK